MSRRMLGALFGAVLMVGCDAMDDDWAEKQLSLTDDGGGGDEEEENRVRCLWEHTFGGRAMSPLEKEHFKNVIDSDVVCNEARSGLLAMMDKIFITPSDCPMAGSFNPIAGTIRIAQDAWLPGWGANLRRYGAHEYAHKLWSARTSWIAQLFYRESYEAGQPGAEAHDYERKCFEDRNWTFERQVGGGGGEGGGGGGGGGGTDGGGWCEWDCWDYDPSVLGHCNADTPTCCAEAGGWFGEECFTENELTGGFGSAAVGVMTAGRRLRAGEVLRSPDGRFHLDYQTDGNLVLYQNGVGYIWTAWTHGTAPGRAVMQVDGNFVVYDAYGNPRWHTYTWGNGGAYLKLQNDGNLVLYSWNGVPLWHTHTCCR